MCTNFPYAAFIYWGLGFKLSPHLHFDKKMQTGGKSIEYVTYVYFNDEKPIFAVTGVTKITRYQLNSLVKSKLFLEH